MSALGYAGTGYEPTWTTRQVAEFLGLAVQTIYNMISTDEPGFPKPLKQGRKNAFIPSEVAAYRAWVLGLDTEEGEENDCEGHESLKGEHMGMAVYCDGTCMTGRAA